MNRGNILPTGLVMILLFSPLLTTTIAAPLTVSRLQANQGATVDSWPTFHHDASRSGFASGAAPHSPLVLWSFGTHGSIESSPVIENGVVYISSEDGYTYALNQSTGGLIWRSATGYSGHASSAIYGDSLYVPSGVYFSRLTLSTGASIWRFSFLNAYEYINYNSLLAVNGRVYAASEGKYGRIYCVNATDGTLVWNFTINTPTALAEAGGIIYVGSGYVVDGSIYALNATNGAVVWRFQTPYIVAGGPTVDKGVLYAGSAYERSLFFALNAMTGAEIWQVNTTAIGSPAIAYGILFMVGGSGIRAYNATDGAIRWTFRFNTLLEISDSLPAVADGLIFAGGGGTTTGGGFFPDPTIYALDAVTGKVVWSFPVGDASCGCAAADASPAVVNGVVYVGASNGVLYAIGSNPPPGLFSQIASLLWPIAAAIGLIAGVLLVLRRWKRTRLFRG